MKRVLCAALAVLLLWGCAAAPGAPETTLSAANAGPVLRPGCYIYDWKSMGAVPLHFRLFEDGTGYLSMLAVEAELTWEPDGTIAGLADDSFRVTPTADGMTWDGQEFTWTGSSLPNDFLPPPPAPGIWAVSSVSRDGDLDFYGSFTRSNGYFELDEDGTGLLVFDDAEYPFTLEGTTAHFDGWSLMLLDLGAEEPDAPNLVMVYIMDGPIQADSIAFRKLEE